MRCSGWNLRIHTFLDECSCRLQQKVKLVCSFHLRQHESNLPDNLFNWWQYTKYILFSNHSISMTGHLCCRTLSRQRSKQNLFPRMPTWQMMYITISGRQTASWLRSIAQWIYSWYPMFHHTHKVMPFEGSSRVPGCWHPRSSCHLHYSFFTEAEPL